MKTKILEIIDNKIEDVQSCIDYAKGEWEIHYKGKKEGLQELRSRLLNNK